MSEDRRKGLARRTFLKSLGLGVSLSALAPIIQACGPAPQPTATPASAGKPAEAPKPTAAPAGATQAPATQAPAATTAKPAAEATKPAAAPTQAPAAAPQSKSGLVYQPRTLNSGKPLEMDAWDWHQPRIDIWKNWFEEWGKIQKNVKISITQVPQAEYLKKLQTAIPSGTAPDMFYLHNQWHSQLVDTQLVDPLPEDRFPRDVLTANFQGVKEGYFSDAKTHQVRYLCAGVMHGGVYYNKDLWEKAGLKESDLPKTWDDLAAKAKLLTQYDSAGRINVAGFAFNGAIGSMFGYLRYQTGEFTYNKDGTKIRLDTPGYRKSLQYLLDLYDKYKVNSREFLPSNEAFQNGKAAMIFAWSWVTGWLKTNAKNLNWGIIASPTWTGKFQPAVGPNNFDPQSFVVPSTTKPEKKEAAWDYIHWMWGSDERILMHAMVPPSPPSVKGLADNPVVQKDPTLKALMPQTEWTIFSQGGPPMLGQLTTKYIDDGIFKAGMSIDEALKKYQAEADQIMAQGDWSGAAQKERAYIHADLMNPD